MNKITSQNIPNYKPQTQRSNLPTANNTQNIKVNKTPKQKIDLNTGGVGKGSNDPIAQHNRFANLPIEVDMEEGEEDRNLSRPPPIPPKPLTEKRIIRIASPDKVE